MVLCFKRQPFRFLFYLTEVRVKCRMAAVKRLPIVHHSDDFISVSFGNIQPILVTWKNRIPLKLGVCVGGGGGGGGGLGGAYAVLQLHCCI